MKKFISLILTIISMVVFSVSAFADDPMVTRGQAEHCVGTDGRVGQIICTSSRTYARGTQKTGCQHGRVGYVDVRTQYEKVENYLYELDLENGYIQELGEHEEEYVPTWEY